VKKRSGTQKLEKTAKGTPKKKKAEMRREKVWGNKRKKTLDRKGRARLKEHTRKDVGEKKGHWQGKKGRAVPCRIVGPCVRKKKSKGKKPRKGWKEGRKNETQKGKRGVISRKM